MGMPTQAITKSAIELLQEAEGFRRRAEQSFGEFALEAGRLLLEAKKRTPHGQWAEYVGQYWGGSLRTAEVYMRARRRFNALPARERDEVLQQPFTRSLLVLSQAPRQQSAERAALPQHAGSNGTHTPLAGLAGTPEGSAAETTVEGYLREHNLPTEQLETTQLLNQALDYQPPAETEEGEEDEDFTPEPTPLDDILDGPRVQSSVAEPEAPVLTPEMQVDFARAINEVGRLEAEVRRLQSEVLSVRAELSEATTNGHAAAQLRGWDYVANLTQYLKADEAQRTPESLARRAASLADGRTSIAYLAQFFASAQVHLAAIA
jgi:hypothetical protein